ncbi:putative secondary metabolism biosynthetic enzyme [Diatrype stigma]|uniref:Secondary metabolism biosynthetic enzyme n=1 Tax=Diatrype stigma TaxID=117547 RepID=A0AAN9YRA7_9PEZI
MTTFHTAAVPADTAERPTIPSAFGAFQDTRLRFDEVGKSTQTLGFWDEAYPHQARLVLAYVVEAFAELESNLQHLQPGDAVPQVKALDKHKQLVRRFYSVLEDGNVIALEEGGKWVRTAAPIDPTPAETIYHEIIDLHPQHADVNKLVRVVGSQLAACLVGDVDGLQLVFGNKENKKLLDDMYEFWPLLRTPTLLLGNFLAKALSNAAGKGKFRILEIGAGTGGTTRHIISRLQSQGIEFEYVFTDISAALVAAAKRQFKNVEGMSFELLDIEKPPKPEYEGAFHCIISTNCIHATKNLDVSLLHLRKMLREDGALTLVEMTQQLFWLDIVVGLFEGWWLFEDGRTHALIDEKQWAERMKRAGFKEVLWTEGDAPESKTVRVIGAFPTKEVSKGVARSALETVVYKRIGDKEIHADVYYPTIRQLGNKKRPVALMIHSGSHITSSRKDVQLAQIEVLLERGFLPVSIDYRLSPEMNISEGPMVDICDALYWARNTLPHLQLPQPGLEIDGNKVVVVGWALGGQLAMSLAWTAPQRGLCPPEAILAFYNPATGHGNEEKALPQPSTDEIKAVSARAQIHQGNYRTPTFLVHGTANDLIPSCWEQSQDTYEALVEQGVEAGVALIQHAPHTYNPNNDSTLNSAGWKAAVQGYEFLSSYVF